MGKIGQIMYVNTSLCIQKLWKDKLDTTDTEYLGRENRYDIELVEGRVSLYT